MATPYKFKFAIYRVTQFRRVCGHQEEPAILWEGSNVAELCDKYPFSDDYRKDRLYPFTNDDMSVSYRFEGKNPGADWVAVRDPRPRLYLYGKRIG